MPTYPALHGRTVDMPRIAQIGAGVQGQQIQNRLGQARLGALEADRQRQNQLRGVLPQAMAGDPSPARAGARAQASALDPSMVEAFAKMDEAERTRLKGTTDVLGRMAAASHGADPLQRAQIHAQAAQYAAQAGMDPSGWPDPNDPNYDAWLVKQMATMGDVGAAIEKAEAGGFTLSAGQTRYDASGKPIVSQPKAPGGSDASVMERLRWMYAFGEDPKTRQQVDPEARAAAGKALAPGSAETREDFERSIYAVLRRGFVDHDEALKDARRAADAFFEERPDKPSKRNRGDALTPTAEAAPAHEGPLPPDVPIKAMSIEQIDDFIKSGGDALSDEDLRRARDRLKELMPGNG